MKTRSLSRVMSLILVLCLALSSVAVASAAEAEVQPRFTAFASLTCQLDITSAGRADCWGLALLQDDDNTATLTFELQRSSDGYDWDTIKTWSVTETGCAVLEKSWYVLSGYQYRVCATAIAYDTSGNHLETVIWATNVDEY